jgi:hypothetical protein
MTDEIREYNGLEIRLLGELMAEFRKACRDAGYMPSSWQGPGCLATAMMRKHKIPKRKVLQASEKIPPLLWNDANDSYYGGRFEVTATGQIDNPVVQSDINSAYPAAMQELPCLIHGEWYYGEFDFIDGQPPGMEMKRGQDLWLGYGQFEAHDEAWLYGLPVRSKNGTIRFPANGNGWYWSVEVDQAIHQTFRVQRYWRYERKCDCQPFDFLTPLYEERKRIGKTGKGKVLKLGMNSLYGKTAQSVGHAPYANPIHASLITALTRSKMMGRVHDSSLCAANNGMCGKDVYMLATDGLFRDSRLHIGDSSSGELGGWDVTQHEGMFIVQPGLYYCEGNELAKTRGLPRERFVEFLGRFRECWERIGIGTNLLSDLSDWDVSVPVQSFVGLRLARVRNWKKLGQWDHKCEKDGCAVTTNHIHKTVSFDWSGKRHVYDGEVEGNVGGGAWRSRPQQGDVSETNHPYDKAIGAWRNDERLLTDDNPDWSIFI